MKTIQCLSILCGLLAAAQADEVTLKPVGMAEMPDGCSTKVKTVELYGIPDSHSWLLTACYERPTDGNCGQPYRIPLAVISAGGGVLQNQKPLELREVTGDGVPEIVVRNASADGVPRVRIYRIDPDLSPHSAPEAPHLLLDVRTSGVDFKPNGRILVRNSYREGAWGFPEASTYYVYNNGMQPIETEGDVVCPPGWQPSEHWAVDAKGDIVKLRTAMTEDNVIGCRKWVENVPRELLPEGTARNELNPPFRFSDASGMQPNRRIYRQLGQMIAPLLPYQECARISRASLAREARIFSVKACAGEARRGLLPVVTEDGTLGMINPEHPEKSLRLSAPLRRDIPDIPYGHIHTANQDTIRWLDDRHFVLARVAYSEISWVVYAERDGSFSQVAQGSFSHRDTPGGVLPSLVVRDGKLLALYSPHLCNHREEVIFDPQTFADCPCCVSRR